jgi:uncharacterized SAM-binding protein YcdF (DUF218 family)
VFYPLSKVLWLLAAPASALILITAAGISWAVLRKSISGMRLGFAGACALLLCSFTPVYTWFLLPLENRFPEWEASSQSAPDGIIAVGGDAGEGLAVLIELGRHFPNARLLFSGPGESPADFEATRSKFALFGGNPARVTWETRSRNTYENAIYSAELVQPKPSEHWLLITSALHMPRTVACFRRAGFTVEAYPINFRGWNVSQSPIGFDSGSIALSTLDAAAKEWIGLIVYRLAGMTDAFFPGP